MALGCCLAVLPLLSHAFPLTIRPSHPLSPLRSPPLLAQRHTRACALDDRQTETASPAAESEPRREGGLPSWLLLMMVFTHVLANALLAQAVPTAMLRAMNNDRVRAAHALGRLSACGAALDILVAPQLGRLSDAIGRKPLLLGLPCIAFAFRAFAAASPTIGVLVAVKALGATMSSGYMVSLRASLADQHRLGLVSSASGAAHAVGMLMGGHLVATSLRLPYTASAGLLGLLLVPVVFFKFEESLPPEQLILRIHRSSEASHLLVA
ncbi:MAG: hypothetical protein SGPRY_006706 [Prymnesium sp.]